ncbi:MutS-related protein [Parablautia muri]|uniref:DNA mismatch repair proteins mutS family domain-containing protein n=1 Tax=Parablautia muri TaxID=2320879 RepID=A0A9X5GUN9_9FIRM|nr:hypothetical protein [Parablautia muri]NBJ94287.1 hypothetical protein [Parablautia muri]
MEYIIFAAAMAGLIVLFMLKGLYDYKKSEKKFIKDLYENYGTLPQREYKPEQFENISHYFLKHADGFVIDDITWNDLNMDEIFKKLNYTYSAAGEEYLYYILRKPCMDEAEFAHREEIIEFFRAHPDERVAYQFIFSKLGRTGKFSIYDYLDYLDELGQRSNLPDYFSICLLLAAVGFMFVNMPLGLVAFVCVLVSNNVSYFKVKEEIDPYITSFTYVFRILETVKRMQAKKNHFQKADFAKAKPAQMNAQKIDSQEKDVLAREFEIMKKCCGTMGSFKRGSFLVMSGGRMSGSSNPLEMILDFIRMGFHVDLIKFNQMLAQVRKNLPQIDAMITVLGQIEAMIAIGAYRQSLADYCVPVFTSKAEIKAEDLYHPLIENPVKNDIKTHKSVLITGSNASGKSTFLKTVAINGIFAQTIHTCLAKSYRSSLFYTISSMSLKDDIQSGESYYMVEIKALKRILDLRGSVGAPVLCFVDEVLRGTNTIERIAASAQILKSLSQGNCLCFAATHDIELTHLLEDIYSNYHFSEEIEEDDIFFCYKIMEGRASTRNAIKLLSIMGYEPLIIHEAEHMAEDFLESGVWHRLDCGMPQ